MIWDAWLLLGFVAQLLFSMRFGIQWLASERRKQSYIPPAFWHLSLAGGILLLLYAIHRRDPVFILGQASGICIYARNLYFIAKHPPGGQAQG
jgi:lipid-A-disaccharide synthase-like uncharacterized protein